MTFRLLVVGLVITIGACAKTTGTETGNPPLIVTGLISVEAVDEDHVRVSGDAGAIAPGGGEVSVTNTSRDGEPVVVEVADDGSFTAELAGVPDDDYEIVATNADGSSPASSVSSGGTAPGDWQTLHACDDTDPSDPLTVTALQIEGDTLLVDVSHGGGCEAHSYGLCWEELWAASFPVQVGLRVLHDDGGDACDALLSEQLTFDLTPFKHAYAEMFGEEDVGAASLGFTSCAIEGEPEGSCGVLYEWGDPTSDCGPPIGPACPPFEIPEAPETWVAHPTECRFSFRGPDDLMNLDVQGTDSCVDELMNDACSFHAGSGAFSSGLAELEDTDEYAVGQAAIQGFPAKVVTSVLAGEPRPFVAGAHFPQPPFATDPSFDVTADLVIFCATRDQRDAMIPALGTIRFD